ncbi:ubiquitin-like domain-containing protein [Paenibacillus ginsengihumi]|uniref:ubiquitin-like domain-containing protein n=1 Tax=Paenibacillus ginsengihumi TaxID=431596 RepID=UPI0003829EE1
MSYALRWKHENLRLISIVLFVSFAITFMFLMMLYGTAAKKLSIVIDGKETTVETKHWVLKNVLEDQGITVNEHDRISHAMNYTVQTGDRIDINRALPLTVSADGVTRTVHTVGRTVEDALEDVGISLGEHDKIQPPLDTALTGNESIKIVRVKKEREEISETIAFQTETMNDPKLLKGKELVVQEGKEGTLVKTKEKVFEDGELVSEQIVEEKVKEPSVNKIVAIGTKNPVTILSASSPNVDELVKSGVKFAYKQVLNNVKLTAYTADASSTGKSEDHPQYGITASGTKVTEGRTIAVDPKVIPLGWWVYIDGLGFRRAEDTGGAVKGNVIDVYFESKDYAKRFGSKRGYTVYVIGPTKPSAD